MRRYNCTLSQWWSRAVQGIFQSGFQLAAPITFAENHGTSTRTSGASHKSTSQARNALAAAEIHFADREQKVESQPALQLVVPNKSSRHQLLSANLHKSCLYTCCTRAPVRSPVFLLILLFGPRTSSRAVAFSPLLHLLLYLPSNI
jgi:hypothetical protein